MERMEATLTRNASIMAFQEGGDPATTIQALRTEVEVLRRREAIHQATLDQFEDQLRLASSLQKNLQSTVPDVRDLDIRTIYRPAGAVSGDMYRIIRLDEHRVAISVIDATGHDVAAALLSVFAKRSLRGKECSASGYRILEPDEVLARANTEIIEADLETCHFVTAIYAVYDERTRLLRWARAGAPYPILHRLGRQPREVTSDGPLLGAVEHATFEIMEIRLEPGDSVIFHTDGLEEVLDNRRHGNRPPTESVVDCLANLDGPGVSSVLDRLDHDLSHSDQLAGGRDDVTVVVLRATATVESSHRAARPM